MALDRDKLKKLLAGISEDDKKAFLEELGGPIKSASDPDITDALLQLQARVDLLEKKAPDPAPVTDPEKGKVKGKGFLEKLDELFK